MGGKGSGRKPGSKNKMKITDFKPAREIQKEEKREGRQYSVPAHVSSIYTSGGCRFGG